MWQLKYLTSHCTVHNKSHGGEDDTSFFLCSFGRFSSAGCVCMSSRYTRMHFYPIIMCTSLYKPLQRGAEHSSGEEAGRKACNNTDPPPKSSLLHPQDAHKYCPQAKPGPWRSCGWALLLQHSKTKISAFTALPPVRRPRICYRRMLYKLLDHSFSHFITKSPKRYGTATWHSNLILNLV